MARSRTSKAGGQVVVGKIPKRPKVGARPSDNDFTVSDFQPRAAAGKGMPLTVGRTKPGGKGETKVVGEFSSPEAILQMFPGLTSLTPEEVSSVFSPPPGDRPPDDFEGIDYGDRAGFEKSVYEVLGENPFDIDPYDAVNAADKRLPELFQFSFGGKILWADRGRMNKAEKDFWDDQVKAYHARIFQEETSKKETLITKYNNMMNQFDKQKKDKEGALDRIRKLTDAPNLKKMVNDEGVLTWHKWDRDVQEFEDTGKKVKAEEGKKSFPKEVSKALEIALKFADRLPAEIQDEVKEGLKDDPSKIIDFADPFKKVLTPDLLAIYQKQIEIINEYYNIGPEAKKGAVGAKAKDKKKSAGGGATGEIIIDYDNLGARIQQ